MLLAPNASLQPAVDINVLGIKGDGSDQGALFNTLIGIYKNVYFTGTIGTSVQLNIPDGGSATGAGDTSVIKALNDMGTLQQTVVMGNNTRASFFAVNGNGFKAGGIMATGKTNVFIEDVNAYGATNNTDAGSSQAFQFTSCTNVYIQHPRGSRCLHGIELWQCTGVFITSPFFKQMRQAGIFTADCVNVQISGGVITDCGDMCCDFEGGTNCKADGLVMANGNNGECTLFTNAATPANGCHSLQFVNCVTTRNATYTDTSGASVGVTLTAGSFDVASLSDNSTACGFFGGTQTINYGAAFATHVVGTTQQDLTWSPTLVNYNYNGPILTINIYGRGNTIAPAKIQCSAKITQTSFYKNWNKAIIGGDLTIIENTSGLAPTVNVLTITSDNAGELTGYMDGVQFIGFDGGVAPFQFDPFTTGSDKFTIGPNCKFSDGFVTNGGLVCSANGVPIFLNTPLRILLGQTANPTWSYQLSSVLSFLTNAPSSQISASVVGMLYMSQQNAYSLNVMLKTASSSYAVGASTGVNKNASYYISSFSGSTINGAANTTNVNIYLDVTLSSTV
jgi:hypothetical protein